MSRSATMSRPLRSRDRLAPAPLTGAGRGGKPCAASHPTSPLPHRLRRHPEGVIVGAIASFSLSPASLFCSFSLFLSVCVRARERACARVCVCLVRFFSLAFPQRRATVVVSFLLAAMYTDDSVSENADYSNSDDEETELYQHKVEDGIRNGHLVVKLSDNTYKCPLSPGKKKQCYKYREILAHAKTIASGKKGPEKVGGHRALVKFLEAELGDKPLMPQAERVLHLEQVVPKREVATRLLAPWMGILVNIDNSRTDGKGVRVAAGAADIKEKFKEYNPERLDVFHDYHGHQGTAVLTFRNDIHGLEDAQAFARSFAAANRGSKEWWGEKRPDSLDLYGWQATEEDLTANLGQLTAHLKKFCDLKTVKDMVEERERINKQVVDDLVKTVDKKNDVVASQQHQFVVLRNMVNEVDALRVKAEEEKKKMEEQHKRDLEAMQLQSQVKEAAHNARVLQHQVTLTNKLRELENRCETMKKAEMQMKQRNEAERQQFEKEKQDAQRLLEEVSRQAEVHAALQCKQRDEQKKIIKKHEGENKALEMAVQNQKKQLMERQQLELQKQHVTEMLEIEKSNETGKDRIAELESELESILDMTNALMMKERAANDQLEEARKAAVQVLKRYGDEDKIGNKLMGCINKAPWEAACKKKFKYHVDGWDFVMATIISEWEDRMKNESYHPYRNVRLGDGDNWKRVIDEDDEHIKKLKNDLGAEVLQTVAAAFFEMEEFNASGRYPVVVAWDFQKNQRVLLKDLLLYLQELLDSGQPAEAKKKRVRAV